MTFLINHKETIRCQLIGWRSYPYEILSSFNPFPFSLFRAVDDKNKIQCAKKVPVPKDTPRPPLRVNEDF